MMICLFLYYQFHAEAALGGFLYHLTARCREFYTLRVAQLR